MISQGYLQIIKFVTLFQLLMNVVVSHYSRIRNGKVVSDNELLFNIQGKTFDQFSESVYRQAGIQYPKFHKMDHLSKLGFLAADILLKNNNLDIKADPYQTGVILSNHSSSLDTDIRYYNMAHKGIASPAVFVYSLPNIVIGEICIRHGIKGENNFFISDHYDIPSQVDYINHLFNTGVIESCIGGWVELINETYDAFLYYAVKEIAGSQFPQHTPESIIKLYHSN